MKKWMNLIIVLGGLAIALLAINMALPSILLPRLNGYLASFSPVYKLHIESMRVNLFRMAYGFEDVHGTMKATDKPFLAIKDVDVSIAWKELLHLRVLTKIYVVDAEATLTKALFQDSKKPEAKPKEDASNVRDTLFPVKIARVALLKSRIAYGELVKQPNSPMWKIRDINGFLTNVYPSEEEPLTPFEISGELLKNGRFEASGKMNRETEPADWSVKLRVKDVHLPETNPALIAWVPLNFSEGNLEIFAEAHSVKGKIAGYLKPYFDHAKVFSKQQSFKSTKHLVDDILAAVANLILRRHDDKSVAAVIPFHSDGKDVKVETGTAIDTALEHGFEKPLKRGLQNGQP